MNLDGITQFPTSLDLLHLILAVGFAVCLVASIRKGNEAGHSEETKEVEPPKQEKAPEAPKPTLTAASPDSALQLLGLLQQEARFIDFVQEDLSAYSDEEIGGVARVVHEGSKKTLEHYFKFENIRGEEEESKVNIPEGFDASEVRLTGNVVGEAPFDGTLIHKGWRATDVNLPKTTDQHDLRVIAPAEVEL